MEGLPSLARRGKMGTAQCLCRKSGGAFCNVSRGGKDWFFKLGSGTLGFYLRISGVIRGGEQEAKMTVETSAGLSFCPARKDLKMLEGSEGLCEVSRGRVFTQGS